MDSGSSFSHPTNYHNENRSHLNQPQQQQQTQQLATQFPQSPPSQQITILSILQEGRMQLDDINSKPTNSGDCLLKSLVLCINQLLAYGDQLSNNYTQFLPENMRLPMITIDLYIARILKYSPCSKECFITILIYIDRLISKRNFIVNSYNIHRILITSILVAAKYLDDIFYNNHFYSQVGGVSVKEINVMELDLLKLLSFDVGANLESYAVYANSIELYNKKIQSQLHSNNPIGLPISIPTIESQDHAALSIHLALKDQDSSSSSSSNSFYKNQLQQSSSSSSFSSTTSTSKSDLSNSKSEPSNVNSKDPKSKSNDLSQNKSSFIHQPLSSFRYQPQPDCVA